jgi:D-amino-acid dehydrogenase
MSGRAVVIGAGAIGMASAYFLQRSGWAVTVVDRSDVGRACSYGNCCLIVPSHSDPIPAPGVIGEALRFMLSRTSPFYVRPRFDPGLLAWSWKFRKYCNKDSAQRGYDALLSLSRGSLALYQELRAHGEIDFFFETRGVLVAYFTERGIETGRHERTVAEGHGFHARLLSRDETLDLEPALSSDVRGALYTAGEAHGLSYGYVKALERAVLKRGGRVLTGRPVANVLARSERIVGVALEGPEEVVDADVVVLSAGSWSRELARGVGIDIPLQPAKGYSCTVDAFEGAPRIPVMIHEKRVVVTPLERRIRFGGTLELAGLDSTIDPGRYRAVIRAAREALAAEVPLVNEEAWSGLRPVTPDGLPIIDRPAGRGLDGLIVATGHAMLGFTQSPMTGKLVSELANGDPPSVPLEPFRLARF